MEDQPEIVYSLKQEAQSLQSLQDWINKNLKDKHCPICQNTKWSIPDKFLELRSFSGGNLVVGAGSVYPFVAFICAECGYTMLFNAVMAGLIEKPGGK